MTLSEIKEEYKKIFILIIETAGEEENNPVYKSAEKIINEQEKIVGRGRNLYNIYSDDEFELKEFIMMLCVYLITEIHGVNFINDSDIEELKSLIDDMYSRYLYSVTRKFTSKNGLMKIDSITEGVAKILLFVNKNDKS